MEFNLLTKKQVKNMSVFNEQKSALITDYATMLGGKNINGYGNYYLKQPFMSFREINYVDHNGEYKKINNLSTSEFGIRPAVLASELYSINNSFEIIDNKLIAGEYPQTKVDEELKKELNKAREGRDIFLTGKYYTSLYGEYEVPEKIAEYRYKGNQYVHIGYCFDESIEWFKVEPIKWLIDAETKLAVSEKILVAGIKYDRLQLINKYNSTSVKKYLDNYFGNELYISGVTKEELEAYDKNKLDYLKKVKSDINDKMLRISLLQVSVKTKIVVNRTGITAEEQEIMDKLTQEENELKDELRKIDLEISDYSNENIIDGKVLTKRIS